VKYEEIENNNNDYYIEQINSSNKENVVKGLLGLALYGSDFEFIQNTLVNFSKNKDENIRGIAILGFGHIARLYGKIDKDVVMPIVQNGLRDISEIVKGQSTAALDDINFFTEWWLFLVKLTGARVEKGVAAAGPFLVVPPTKQFSARREGRELTEQSGILIIRK
jgi:hypothetical protein